MKQEIKEFFAKNPNTENCYETSDGNLFAVEHYATNWARGFKDDKVETHAKVAGEKPKAKSEKADETGARTTSKLLTAATDDKANLTKRYVELFDKKPAHNLGLEKMKLQMAEAEAKLVAEENAELAQAQAEKGEKAE